MVKNGDLKMRLHSILLGTLAFVALASELISYNLPSLASRIVLLIGFSSLLSMIMYAHSSYIKQKPSVGRAMIFAMLIIISLSFLLRRYYSLSPSQIEAVVHYENFVVAERYSENGTMQFDSPHSFLFQHPLMLSFLSNVSGIPVKQVVYISLLTHTVLVALAGTILFEIVRKAFRNDQRIGASVIPPLIAFSLVSFAYSERSEIALPLTFLLMSYLFDGGITDRRKAAVILMIVIGITFGSATSILMMIPFFFLFTFFRRIKTTIVYALIPLAYLINAGYSYTLSLRYYSLFSLEGFSDFLSQLFTGKLPERVLPWERFTLPTAEDMYVTSVAYLSLLSLGAIVAIICLFILARKNLLSERSDREALFTAAFITLLFALGTSALAYVGASVSPETTSSDIRTIAVVFTTILLPFLFISNKLLERITASRVLLTMIVALTILGSLRTFYEVYPISKYDPVNVVEDLRVDPFSIHSVGEFLKSFKTKGDIAFDFKIGLSASGFLSPKSFQLSALTSGLTFSSLVVFDIKGLKLGSLHTTKQAYAEAYNLTLTENVIYNSGDVLVIMRKPGEEYPVIMD